MIPALEGLLWEGPRGLYYLRPSDHQVLLPIYIVKIVNVTDKDYKFYELIGEIPAAKVAPPCQLPEAFADRCKDEKMNAIPEEMMKLAK